VGQASGLPYFLCTTHPNGPTYFFPFFADFFGAAFFEGIGFFAVDFAPPFFAEKAFSQPSEYCLFGPTRRIVTFLPLKEIDQQITIYQKSKLRNCQHRSSGMRA